MNGKIFRRSPKAAKPNQSQKNIFQIQIPENRMLGNDNVNF